MTQQKNKREDSKVESDDSPEIPDRGETSHIPSLPLGITHTHNNRRTLTTDIPDREGKTRPVV